MTIIKICYIVLIYSKGKLCQEAPYFWAVGKNVRLPSGLIPLRAESIFLHNNIEVASGARLIPHDAIHTVFSNMDGKCNSEHIGKIEVFDNVFIGAGAIILGPCKIGPNAIIGAGALVNKNVPEGAVVGGVPAKILGDFESTKAKRSDDSYLDGKDKKRG